MDEQTWNERARDILRRWLYRYVPPDLGVRQEINALLEEADSDEPRCPTCDGDGEVVEDHDDEGRPILVVPCPDCYGTGKVEWRLPSDKPSYDLQGIEHRVLVAEGHAVPFGDGWLLQPHRWRHRTPAAEPETQIEITDEGFVLEEIEPAPVSEPCQCDHCREGIPATGGEVKSLRADDVEWVVNSLSELGVKIGNQFFWLYKGHSLVYKEDSLEEEPRLRWRLVGKREFGECCYPVHLEYFPDEYTEGEGWQDLPLLPASATPTEASSDGVGSRPEHWADETPAEGRTLEERLTAREQYVQSRLDGEERHRQEDVAALEQDKALLRRTTVEAINRVNGRLDTLERRLAGDRTPMPPVWADNQTMCTLHWILAQMRVLRGET